MLPKALPVTASDQSVLPPRHSGAPLNAGPLPLYRPPWGLLLPHFAIYVTPTHT